MKCFISLSFEPCHPERSTTTSEASRRAQSKDPCGAGIACGDIQTFSPCLLASAPKNRQL
jgi:hypothetical protein